MNLEDVLKVGDRASQPAANLVPAGTLYAVDDEDYLIEQSTGSVWVQYGPDIGSISGGITELTGNVTAGPGSGSQAATIANDAVTYAKMQNVSTNNRLLGRATAGAGDVEEITLGTNLSYTGTTLNAAGGSGGWTLITNRSVGSGTSEDFTSGFSTYNDILIEVIGATLGGAAILQCRVSIDGGSNYLSSSGDYQLISTGGIASAQTSMTIASTSSTGPFFAVRTIAPFNSTVAKISQDGISTNNYYIPTANALNAIRIFPSGGQSFGGAGNIFIYGR